MLSQFHNADAWVIVADGFFYRPDAFRVAQSIEQLVHNTKLNN